MKVRFTCSAKATLEANLAKDIKFDYKPHLYLNWLWVARREFVAGEGVFLWAGALCWEGREIIN